MGNFRARAAAVLLLLSAAAQTQAKEPSMKESRESGMRLETQRQDKIQGIKAPADEAGIWPFDYRSLLPELDNILDETVDAALEEQRESLVLAFEDRTSRLLKSRSFWRRAALGELLVILGSVFGCATLNMLSE